MELNKTLNDSLAVLHGLSAADLDTMLQIDSPPWTSYSASQVGININDDDKNISKRTDAAQNISKPNDAAQNNFELSIAAHNMSKRNITEYSIMHFNREPFPSQMDDSQCSEVNRNQSFQLLNRSNFNFSHLWATPDTDAHNNSMIITSPAIEVININDTEEPRINENAEASHEKQMLQFPQAETINKESLNLSSIKGTAAIESSFQEQFAKLNDIDFDEGILDLDFDEINKLEQAHSRTETIDRMHKTQADISAHNKSTTSAAGMYTCPPRIQEISSSSSELRATASSVPLSDPYDPIKFLTLDYGDSIQNSNNYQQMNVTSNVASLIHSSPVLAALDYSTKGEQTAAASQLVTGVEMRISTIDAHNRKVTMQHCSNITSNSSAADATLMPPSVAQLFEVIKSQYSDFSFIYALSAQLCQERVPMDCFVNLKMGLLLSLASIGPNPDRPPIPVIAIGNDPYMSNYLLTNIGQLAARFIGPTDDIKPPATGSGGKTYTWIEADPIILAKGGVFYVGDWSRLKAPRADKLFKDIECSRVAIDNTTYVFPLETAIWAHWRSFKCNAKDQQMFNNFVKVFGIPIIVDDVNHNVLVNYTLEQSSVRIFESTVDHLSVSAEDMRQFLAVIAKRTVDLSAEASSILQKYFVASRIERPDCLSKQAFTVLKQFSESFAKLAFRHEVLPIDAYAAIFMCENFMQNIFGANEHPPPQFEAHNYVGNVDEHIIQFQKWVENYIQRYYDKP